mmetsp:Transcript_17042/g.35049  ORF Transcript_17042/g.35049 Transcript_17042/m.35049 type:complete len:652 (-) Transcript_17042:584-2539(-)
MENLNKGNDDANAEEEEISKEIAPALDQDDDKNSIDMENWNKGNDDADTKEEDIFKEVVPALEQDDNQNLIEMENLNKGNDDANAEEEEISKEIAPALDQDDDKNSIDMENWNKGNDDADTEEEISKEIATALEQDDDKNPIEMENLNKGNDDANTEEEIAKDIYPDLEQDDNNDHIYGEEKIPKEVVPALEQEDIKNPVEMEMVNKGYGKNDTDAEEEETIAKDIVPALEQDKDKDSIETEMQNKGNGKNDADKEEIPKEIVPVPEKDDAKNSLENEMANKENGNNGADKKKGEEYNSEGQVPSNEKKSLDRKPEETSKNDIAAVEHDSEVDKNEKDIAVNEGNENNSRNGQEEEIFEETIIFAFDDGANNDSRNNSVDTIDGEMFEDYSLVDTETRSKDEEDLDPFEANTLDHIDPLKVETKKTARYNDETLESSAIHDENESVAKQTDAFDKELEDILNKDIEMKETKSKKMSTSPKKGDAPKKYYKPNKSHDTKFVTKLPALQHRKHRRKENVKLSEVTISQPAKDKSNASTIKRQKEVPLWKLHSKDFTRKGGVEKTGDSKQSKGRLQKKLIKQWHLEDRLNTTVDVNVTPTKESKTFTKNMTPKAMSIAKRNEELIKKFKERQLVGRQDRAEKEKIRKFVNYAWD